MRKLNDSKNYNFFIDVLKEYDDFIIVSETDTKGIITYASKGFCNISGYTREELIGKNHNIVRDPYTEAKIFENLWQKLKKLETVKIDKLSNKKKNGEIYFVEATFTPIFEDGKHIGYRSLRKDITNTVKLDVMYDQIVKNNEFLIYQNKKMNTELVKSEKKLSIFKDDIISIFTHELKTPLNAIINFAEYIQRNINNNPTTKKMEKIALSAKKIFQNGNIQLELIDSILELALVKSGKLTLNKTHENLKNLIDPIMQRYDGVYEKSIEVDIDENINVNIDKKLFTIIFTNIYSNALKYSKSKIKITVKKYKDSFLIKIEDDGSGIKEQDRKKIFEMFSRLENKSMLQREEKGTGIGLYTVNLLIDFCDLQINIDNSEDYGGSCFTISEKDN